MTTKQQAPLVLLVNERVAAEALGVKPRTLQQWRFDGGGPPFVRISGRCVRYRIGDLERWAASRVFTSTSDTGAG